MLEACNFIKKRLQNWCFFCEYREIKKKTPILKNICERLLSVSKSEKKDLKKYSIHVIVNIFLVNSENLISWIGK